jgi:DNA-binding XRE family transcriptional regulator
VLGGANTHTAAYCQDDTLEVERTQQKSVQCYDLTGIQCRLARVALGWGLRELAKAADVSQQTIVRLEKGEELRPATLERIKDVLEENGIIFIPADENRGVGIRFRDPT